MSHVLPVSEAEVDAYINDLRAVGDDWCTAQQIRQHLAAAHTVLVPALEGALGAMRSERRHSRGCQCDECWARERTAFWDHLRRE